MLTDQGDFPSTTILGLEGNTVADGLFHAASWLAVVVGLVMLFRTLTRSGNVRGSWPTLVGGLLMGWGLFNLVEGVVDHHILTVHHVRDDVADPLPWDLAFLAFGALLLVGGWALTRRDRAGVDVRAVGDEAVDPGRGGRPAGERVSRLPR